MGALLGLMLGLGLLLVWQGFAGPAARRTRRTGRRTLHDRLAELIAEAGLEAVTPRQLLVSCAGAGGFVGLVFLVVSRTWPLAFAFGAFAAYLPEALTQLGIRGPEQLRQPFLRFGEDYRATGHFRESLDQLKDRLADPTGDRICESLRIAREVGGSDLGRLLRTLSSFLRQDARTRAELETRQSWVVNAARLAVAAPWLLLGLLSIRTESIRAYNAPAGWIVLGVGAGLCVVAYRLMLRLGRLPVERRVLR